MRCSCSSCCWSSKWRLSFWQIAQCHIHQSRQSLNNGFEQGLVATGRFQLSVVVAVVVLIRISSINTSKESTKHNPQENNWGTGTTVVLWVCCEQSLLLGGMSVLCQRVFLDTGYWVLVQPFAEVRWSLVVIQLSPKCQKLLMVVCDSNGSFSTPLYFLLPSYLRTYSFSSSEGGATTSERASEHNNNNRWQ